MFPEILENSEIGGFELMKEINTGSFSSVYKCVNKSNRTKGLKKNKKYALKIFTNEEEYGYIPDAEAKVLSDLGKHKNVAYIYAIVNLKTDAREKFRAAIMPLALYDLSVMIHKHGKLPAEHGHDAFLQICNGLQHIHTKEIAHGDIKPNNILVYVEDGEPCYKITDFDGFQACGVDNEVHTTKEYSPPEFVLMEKYTIKSDIWSLACTLIEMRTGLCLFDDEDEEEDSDDDESSICYHEEIPSPDSFVYKKLQNLLKMNTKNNEEHDEESKNASELEECDDGSSCCFSRSSDSDSENELEYDEIKLLLNFVHFLGPFPKNISINFPTLLTKKGFMINHEKDGSKDYLLDFLVQELGVFDAKRIFDIVLPMFDYSDDNRPSAKNLLKQTKFVSYVDELKKLDPN